MPKCTCEICEEPFNGKHGRTVCYDSECLESYKYVLAKRRETTKFGHRGKASKVEHPDNPKHNYKCVKCKRPCWPNRIYCKVCHPIATKIAGVEENLGGL